MNSYMEGKIYFGKLDDFESNKRDDEEIPSVEYKKWNLVLQPCYAIPSQQNILAKMKG